MTPVPGLIHDKYTEEVYKISQTKKKTPKNDRYVIVDGQYHLLKKKSSKKKHQKK